MKKKILLCLVLALIPAGAVCWYASHRVTVFYGSSQLYTKAEIDAAVQIAKETFSGFDGCTLYLLSYAGDEASQKELARYDGQDVTACIELNSCFRSPKHNSGALEPNELYFWHWTVVRDISGNWRLDNYGYA